MIMLNFRSSQTNTDTEDTGSLDDESAGSPIYISSDESVSSVEGVPGEYYGGYGRCFRCGK